LDTYESRLRQLRPALTGADLRGAGLQPGVAYRDTLARLRAARADGEVATEMEEWQLLRRLLAEDRLGGADAASDGSRRRKPDAG
jgi:tRNA nucleotidyltransferase (CCA-adding enzyme)